jgi:hypothetical protein
MDPKDEEAQEQEETEKKADTYALFFPSNYKQDSSSSSNDGSSTASAPPSDFARARMCNCTYLDALTLERVHNKNPRALEQTISVLPL